MEERAMDVVVWNSQGAKWDTFWTSHINPLVAANQDIVGLLVEAGWAPRVASGDVVVNNVYPLDRDLVYYDATASAASPFCQAVTQRRRVTAYWIPWVKNLDAMKTNTRCSLGGRLMPVKRLLGSGMRYDMKNGALFRRPVFRFDVNKPNDKGGIPELSIFLVHLVSGWPNTAQEEMDTLISEMSRLVPQGSSASIVGDMNIDLNNFIVNLPNHWRLLNRGARRSSPAASWTTRCSTTRTASTGLRLRRCWRSTRPQTTHPIIR
jgi:hypothetical protein